MGFQNWATPPAFIEWCEKEVLPIYGQAGFTLDSCATIENAKAPEFIGPPECEGRDGYWRIDGLRSPWETEGAVWCNPGFADCALWLDKAASEAERGNFSLVLTHACHGARWFRDCYKRAAGILLINPRINFLPPKGVTPSSNTRDSYLWVFNGPCRPFHKFIYPNAWRN